MKSAAEIWAALHTHTYTHSERAFYAGVKVAEYKTMSER